MLNIIYAYLFFVSFGLTVLTRPDFGYDPLYTKMISKAGKLVNFATSGGISSILGLVGIEKQELYFFLGHFLMYLVLLFLFMYNRITKCLEKYRKYNEKYAQYSASDFFIKYASDVLLDSFKKSIGMIIPPFILIAIFIILIIGLNFGAKIPVVKPFALLVITPFHYGKYLIIPAFTLLICSIFIGIDAVVPC